VLFIGLDSMSWSLVEEQLDAGRLPHLASLRDRGAFARLDAPAGYRTGVAWENMLAGRVMRTSSVTFDPERYTVWQEGPAVAPFFTGNGGPRTIAFDIPRYSLAYPLDGVAVTGWGASHAGFPRSSNPAGLLRRIDATFGPHPMSRNDHEVVWHRPDWVDRMGEGLCEGARLRAEVVAWLQTQTPDWRFCATVLSEPHSAAEALWHGVDPDHPLAHVPSAPAAGRWIRRVDQAVDDAIGTLLRTVTPEDHVVVASMHGMGSNTTDVAAMVLLPELLHRAFRGRPLLRAASSDALRLDADTTWDATMERYLWGTTRAGLRARARAVTPEWLRHVLRRRHTHAPATELAAYGRFGKAIPAETQAWRTMDGPFRSSLDWVLASRYRSAWPAMPAFALPSLDDGIIRLNVQGRERHGVVPPGEVGAWCDRIESLLREVVDPTTGAPVVRTISRGSDGPDLVVSWSGTVLAFAHPSVGVIGPYPLRRPGGHEVPTGFAFVAGPGIPNEDLGMRSAADVTPTLVHMLGLARDVTGESLVPSTTLSIR
jgi:predicted AlkP superfamily phosphohydrolase/phosphomutase